MKNEIKEGILIISPRGNLLNEQGSAAVVDLVKNHLQGGERKILFNLSEVKVVNSNGLGMLLSTLSKTRAAGGEMALCTVPTHMSKLLQMTKLESVFTVYNDEADAISFLKEAKGVF